MKVKKNLLLIMLMIIISTQFLSAIVVTAPLIGDPIYLQSNPFESNPTDGLLIGTPNGGFTPATAGAPNARDGDLETNVNWRIGGGNVAGVIVGLEQNTFESSPPGGQFDIGWVDIKVSYKASATTNDKYTINYTTIAVPGAADWMTLQPWISGASAKFDYYGARDERVWSKKLPNDGTWNWTDIANLKVRVDTQRVSTEDSTANKFYLYEVWVTIYRDLYPPAGPGVSIQPPVIEGLHAGDTFFIDAYVTDVVNMHGFGFVIRYNPDILTGGEFFSYSPFTDAWSPEIQEQTYLEIPPGGFSNARTGWTRVGSAPYIRTVDFPTGYVNATTDGDTIGDFSFADTTSPNYGGKVYIEVNAAGDGDDQIELWLYNGATWQLADTVTPPTTLDPGVWTTSVDVGSILDTMAKINAAKVYFVKKTANTEGEITVDAMRLNVASGFAAMSFSSYMGDGVGFTGSGPVVRVYFSVDVDGSSVLHFDKSTLSNVLGSEIVPNYVYDGVFTTTTPLHDVAVTDVNVNETQTMPGGGIEINVTVANQGTEPEDFTVTAFYNSTPVGTPISVTGMKYSTNKVVTIDWDTTGVGFSHYLISAEATLATDNKPNDNTGSDGIVIVGLHDIAVTNVTRTYYNATLGYNVTLPQGSVLSVEEGTIIFINVTVSNLGNFPETFSLNATYFGGGSERPRNGFGEYITKTWLDITLNSGTSWTDTFAWDTTDINFYVGGYEVWRAVATCTQIARVTTVIPYEKSVDQVNNVFIDGVANVSRSRRPAPIIAITTSNETRVVGKLIDFSAGATRIAEGTILDSLEWDFGDGTRIVYQRPENLTTPYTAVLKIPGENDTYVDRNDNGVWDVGEPAVRDNDQSGTLNTGDETLAGSILAGDSSHALRAPGPQDKYWDKANPHDEWNTGTDPPEPAIRDVDNSGNYTFGDVVLAIDTGEEPPPLETYNYETKHAYATAGTYTVTVTATNNLTLSGTDTDSLYVGSIDLAITNVIRVYPKSVAIPADTLLKVKSGEIVYLNVTVWNYDTLTRTESFNITIYSDDTAVEWLRSTASLNNGTFRMFEFSWNTSGVAAGTYTIKAVLNPIELLTKTYEVNTVNNELADGLVKISLVPAASFSYSPSQPLINSPIAFDASASDDEDGNIVKYAWDFGDGSKMVYVDANLTATTIHAFPTKAVYTVNLTVTDNDGFTHTTSRNVTVYVHDVAVTGVSVSDTEVTAGESLIVTVDIANQGDFDETVTLTILYDDTEIDSEDFDLEKGSSTSVPITWDTNGASAGDYEITAEVWIAVDSDLTDNTMLAEEQVTVKAADNSLLIYAAVGAAIAIIVAGVAVYLLKFRKPKPKP